MATGSRKKSTKSSGRGTYNRKKKKNQNPGIAEEIILFIVLGVSVLLFLGTCGLMGSFGKIIHSVLIGLFGMVGFVFPFAFLFAGAFWIANKWENITKVKVVATFIVLWVLSCFAQLIFAKDAVALKLTDYYTDEAKNGGFLGGITTRFFCKYLGMAGTIVILIVLLVICIVLITDRSLFTSVKEGTKLLSEDYKRNAKYRKEISEIRNIEREERDMQRWQKRAQRHEDKAKRLDEKRALELEARRKKAEEKKAETAERIKFDALNLKNPANHFEQVNDAAFGDEYDESASFEEINSIHTPESIFYGNSSDYISTVREQAMQTASDVTKIMESSENKGLLSATKITKPDYNGDITDITENYCADDEFFDYLNGINTTHKININREEELMQEAYERDMYVEKSDSVNEDFSDVVDLFSNRNRIRINNSVDVKDDSSNVRFTENDIFKENDIKEDEFEFSEPKYSEQKYNETKYDDSQYKNSTYEDKSEVVSTDDFASINIQDEIAKPQPVSKVVSAGKSIKSHKTGKYKLPPVTLLDEVRNNNSEANAANELRETALELKETLKTFGLDVNIIGSSRGPAVTRYELQMPAGVSVKKITNLSDDIMMSLGAKDIRIEAPIPGKKAVGIELPNKESTMVHFRELIDSKAFKSFDSKVAFGVGKDLSGDIVVSDISKMPHLLIAGATGSGKSVCINTLIMSILFKAKPDEVKLIMIDPKMVELSIYNDIPHLLIPVVTDPKKASAALAWAVNEMTTRYQKFADTGVRDMKGYNAKIQSDPELINSQEHSYMPQIVIVVDELADLMMVASKEVEESICRLAQLARAAGIYLILATQRPSVDVITGLIKANMPSRIAFSVSSGVDSRTILDMFGAEKLLGNGDMLFFPRGYNKPSRVQGAFVSDDEVQRVVDFIKGQCDGDSYDESATLAINSGGQASAAGSGGLVDPQGAYDELFVLAGHAVIESDKASIGMLQRKFKIGFNRAARIMDQLSDEGVVGPEEGTKPRKIIMSMEQFNQMLEEKNHS